MPCLIAEDAEKPLGISSLLPPRSPRWTWFVHNLWRHGRGRRP